MKFLHCRGKAFLIIYIKSKTGFYYVNFIERGIEALKAGIEGPDRRTGYTFLAVRVERPLTA